MPGRLGRRRQGVLQAVADRLDQVGRDPLGPYRGSRPSLLSTADGAILLAVLARHDELIVRKIGTETVIYEPRTHRAHCLGRTAAAVWCAWERRSGVGETALRVSQALGEALDEASVQLVLRRLHRAGLIERPAGGSDSRRETRRAPGRRVALRRVGVAAGLAVLSVAVRSPAQVAATCLPNGRPCSRSSQCCSSCCNENSGRCAGGGPNCARP